MKEKQPVRSTYLICTPPLLQGIAAGDLSFLRGKMCYSKWNFHRKILNLISKGDKVLLLENWV